MTGAPTGQETSEMPEPRPAKGPDHQDEVLFHYAVEAVKDFAIILLDRLGRITSWNPGAEYILGYEASEIIGQPFGRLFTPEDSARGEPKHEMNTAITQGH